MCMEGHGFSGIILYSNVGGVYPSFRDHAGLFAEPDRLKATVFIHPGSTPLINEKTCPAISGDIELPQDVTRLVCRFLVEDGYGRYPNISYVLGHGGGMLSYNYERIGKLVYMKNVKGKLGFRIGRLLKDLIIKKYKIDEYLESSSIDLYESSAPEQTAALVETFDSSRWCYGSNFPYAGGTTASTPVKAAKN